MFDLDTTLIANMSWGEALWTLLNLAALVYVTRNTWIQWRFWRFARGNGHHPDAVREARGYVLEEAGRLVVALLFTGVGVAASLIPPPRVHAVTVLQSYEALVFMAAAGVNLLNSYLTHRRLAR